MRREEGDVEGYRERQASDGVCSEEKRIRWTSAGQEELGKDHKIQRSQVRKEPDRGEKTR